MGIKTMQSICTTNSYSNDNEMKGYGKMQNKKVFGDWMV
jgi:hypothetical protein